MATKGALKERIDDIVKEPRQYKVLMHNDDFTTMEFVVGVLIDIFHKNEADANAIMLTVHNKGRAMVGTYPYDIAVTRVNLALTRAKAEGFPFRMTVEEA